MSGCGLYLLSCAIAAAVAMAFAGHQAQKMGATRCLILGYVIHAIGFGCVAIW